MFTMSRCHRCPYLEVALAYAVSEFDFKLAEQLVQGGNV